MEKSFVLHGISISHGIVIGKPYFLFESRKKVVCKDLSSAEVDKEIIRYRGALEKSRNALEHLQKRYIKDGASVVVEILDAHLEILHDPIITQIVEEKIKSKQKNTEAVFCDVIDEYKRGFQNIEDEFVEERIKDIRDVSSRILSNLAPFNTLEEKINDIGNCIIVAHDIVPSDALDSKFSEVLAFVSRKGGYASHAGIIARAKGIPYVAKIDIKKLSSVEIENLIVDGINGKVIVNPNAKTLEEYIELQNKYKKYYQEIIDSDQMESVTKDNVKIRLLSNIESTGDIPQLLAKKADGVGLFRSEYLFLTEKVLPTEERQFQIYKEILEKVQNKPVFIRLFDIGGDKNYFIVGGGRSSFKLLKIEKEQNPVLGCRGIRFLIKNEKIFETQLRALLRASVYGNLKIIIPLLSDIAEFRQVKLKIEHIRKKLRKEGRKVAENIPLGCMVEVPSAALMADVLAKEADFFSIGTNDLTQYVMAADRSNSDTGYLYDFSHPALLRLINLIIKAAMENKKEVSVCGEMAADAKFTQLLIGMGIRSFSVASRHLPFIKHAIRNTNLLSAKEEVSKIQGLNCFLK